MRVISKTNASSLPAGGTEYVPGADGVFDLPEPLGAELTTRHASLWVTEQAARAAANAAEVRRLRDPRVLPRVVAELLSRVAALEAAAASEAKAPKTEASSAPKPEPDPEKPPTAPKPSAPKPSATKAPAKRTAPKKTAASKPEAAPETADAASGETPPPQDPAAPPAE